MEKTDENKTSENNILAGQIGYEEILYSKRLQEEKDNNIVLENQISFNIEPIKNLKKPKHKKNKKHSNKNIEEKHKNNIPKQQIDFEEELKIKQNQEINKKNANLNKKTKRKKSSENIILQNQKENNLNYSKKPKIEEENQKSTQKETLEKKNLNNKNIKIENEKIIRVEKMENKNLENISLASNLPVEKDSDGVITKTLDAVIHDSMIPYTEHVVMDRALPRVEDGLKPVQRRILYSMVELGLTPDKQYRKSARIVGDCMGKYHPHGDSSVYDAMVRMAQDYSLREPLVDGHGNFGSIDGDSAAAMRYTEAKLAPLALELLRDLDKNTVHWSLNFDDTIKEPDMLPGRFPNLLVNGASGIAVGVATNIPPHNLSEVIDGVCAYIKNPKITTNGLMKYIKAPDFPTGGVIIAGEELQKAYETGKGKIINRAKINIEKNGDKSAIVITEVPYQVNKASMLQKIASLKENSKGALAYIGEIIDESDRNGLRAVIKIKKDGNPQAILKELLKSTPLEVSYNINMVAIAGGKPRLLGLKEIISYYVDYQREIIVRRSKFDLDNALARAHIVEGLLKAIDQIDKIIKIIRSSKTVAEAKERIINDIELTDLQAQAILDMRLARLVNLEIVKLQEEYDNLQKLITELKALLASEEIQYQVIIKELQDIKKRFGNERKSEVVLETEQVEEEEQIKEEEFVVSHPCLITISADNKIKNIPVKTKAIDTTALNNINNIYDIQTDGISVMDNDVVLIFTNRGNCLKIKASEIPESKWKKKGVSLQEVNTLIAYNEYPIKVLPVIEGDDSLLITYTKQGFIKRTKIEEYLINRPYFSAMSVRDDDELINVEYEQDQENADTIILITEQTYSLRIETNEIPIQKRTTAGVRSMKMVEKDFLIFAGQAEKRGGVTIVGANGFVKKVPVSEYQITPRYRRGLKTLSFKGKDNNYLVYAKYDAEPNNICVKKGSSFDLIQTNKISYDNRNSKGKALIKGKFEAVFTSIDRTRL